MRNFFLLLALTWLLIGGSQAEAQGHRYLTLGRNPCIPGGVSVERAQAMGWKVHTLQADAYQMTTGASGEQVPGWLPKGTLYASCPDGRMRLLACGNPTTLQPPPITRVEIREKVVIQRVEVPVERTVYAFGPTVYPTSPMPQPFVNFQQRPPVYAQLNFSEITYKNSPGTNMNLFNNSGSTSRANNGGQSSVNGAWNTATGGAGGEGGNGGIAGSWAQGGAGGSTGPITATGGAGGSTGPIQNNNDANSVSGSTTTTVVPVNTGGGSATGTGTGTNTQGTNSGQTNGINP